MASNSKHHAAVLSWTESVNNRRCPCLFRRTIPFLLPFQFLILLLLTHRPTQGSIGIEKMEYESNTPLLYLLSVISKATNISSPLALSSFYFVRMEDIIGFEQRLEKKGYSIIDDQLISLSLY